VAPSAVRGFLELWIAGLCPQGFRAVLFPDVALHVIGMEGSRAVRPDLAHGDDLVVPEPIDADAFVLRICGDRSKISILERWALAGMARGAFARENHATPFNRAFP